MQERIEIIITEDQKLFRQGLIPLLQHENIYTIGEASDGKELLKLLQVEEMRPDIILLDIQMPEMDGNVVLRILKKKFPDLKVIILSSFVEGSIINDFKAKGVDGYLTKIMDFKVIVNTIKNVFYLPNYSNIPLKVKSRFTEGEIQIIPLLCAGKTSKQIGEILNLAEKTVEAYRNRLYEKTVANNAADFATYCTKEGLIFLGNNVKQTEITSQD